jgi:IS30 family transposase
MTYTHLTQEERYQIHDLQHQGLSLVEIAQQLDRHASTIGRELRRNAGQRGYRPAQAHEKASSRQTSRRNARQFSSAQWEHVAKYLRLTLSPEQVSGRLRSENTLSISHESIYGHIYQDKRRGGDLVTLLRCQKGRRKRYGSGRERRGKLNGTCIEQRPKVVDSRSRIGDWEGDTVIGKGHQGALVTLVERKSRYTLARQVSAKQASQVGNAIIEMLRPHRDCCHTLTFDNGKEFADHAFIASCLDAEVYFAHPYCSWERGLNENTNGLLRQYFPKDTNLKLVSQQAVDDAVHLLNHRPRKCLQYRTPHEVFYGLEMQPLKLPPAALRT